MHAFSTDRSRHYLHRPRTVVTPIPDPNACHAAAPGRKQGGMPAEQTLRRQRCGVVPRRIQHHLDDCSPCLAAYDFEAELRLVVRNRCTDQVPDSLRARIAQAIDAEG